MTASQQARIAGFNASLSQRGVSLKIDGRPETFRALINDFPPGQEEGEVDSNTKMFSEVSILRSSTGLTAIEHGTKLIDADNHVYYRVLRAFDYDIKVTFRCEKDQE